MRYWGCFGAAGPGALRCEDGFRASETREIPICEGGCECGRRQASARGAGRLPGEGPSRRCQRPIHGAPTSVVDHELSTVPENTLRSKVHHQYKIN